jgi:tetratricopeptide (TPR) repeat protein
MASKKKKNSPAAVTATPPDTSNYINNLNNPTPTEAWWSVLTRGVVPYAIIAVLSVLLYANTFKHQFALDDDIVICKNDHVLKGLAGLPDIFSKDLFDSFYRQMNTKSQLSGGRYRPLSVASFAIEQEFIGTRNDANFEPNCWDENKNGIQEKTEDINGDGLFNDKDCRSKGFTLRHINNVLFYALACCILFWFLATVVFRQQALLALITTLLFAAHPLHTEVVANVKSRDEIFAFLFIILSLIMAYKYQMEAKMKHAILSALAFLAALLSKEYGATLLGLIPISWYLSTTDKKSAGNFGKLMACLVAAFVVYLMMRSQVGLDLSRSDLQEKEILNSPYLLADETQKLATKIFIFLKYLILLILPHPLSSDYGYNTIPYKDFSDPLVWLSLLGVAAMLWIGWRGYKQKHWSLFAVAFYLFNIALVTNIIFNVGATMGERLAFHSSLGFCMLIAYGLYFLSQKINKPELALLITLPIVVAYSVKTVARNKAWENDITLALTDVETCPNSTALNGNAASRSLDLSELPANANRQNELVEKSIQYGRKALGIHPGFVNGYLNIGIAFAKQDQLDSAKAAWDKAFRIYPNHPNKTMYYNMLANSYWVKGYNLGTKQQWVEGKILLEKAVALDSMNVRYWYDLGGFAFNSGNQALAREAWLKAYRLNPNDSTIQQVKAFIGVQ